MSDISLNINDIKKLIPHRYPFLLIDKVYDIEPEKKCKAIKNVTMNEWFFQGHFPNRPIMPGVLIVEGMAQAAGVLACYSVVKEIDDLEKFGEMYFMSIDKVKFRKIVEPSNTLIMHIEVLQKRGEKIWKFKGDAFVNETLVCESEFMAMMPNN